MKGFEMKCAHANVVSKLLIICLCIITLSSCVRRSHQAQSVFLHNQSFQSAYDNGFNLIRMHGKARSDYQREIISSYIAGINDRIDKLNNDKRYVQQIIRNQNNSNNNFIFDNEKAAKFNKFMTDLSKSTNRNNLRVIDNQLYLANDLIISARKLTH